MQFVTKQEFLTVCQLASYVTKVHFKHLLCVRKFVPSFKRLK